MTPPSGLLQALHDGSAVIVAGAGVSIATANPGTAPTWLGLLRQGLDQVAAQPSGVAAGWRKITELLIESGTTDDLVMAATRVVREMETRRGAFPAWLRHSVGELQPADTSLAVALARLDAPIFTTNYDTLLERVLGRDSITWHEPHLVQLALQGDRQYITHLHGLWTRPDTVIFSLESYQQLKNSPALQALAQALVTARTLVFVGCGQTGADPHLGYLLAWLATTIISSERYHYQLVCAMEQVAAAPAIEQVVYGDSHSELAGYIDAVAASVSSSRSYGAVPSLGFAAAGAGRRVAQNLPRRNPEVFGRSHEVAWLVAALEHPGAFLVVDGPAGCGKTTVALEASHQLLQRVPSRFDVVLWLSGRADVLLADGPAESGEVAGEMGDVVATIAIVLERPDILRAADGSKVSMLRAALSQQHTLLVFDNFETIIDLRIMTFLKTLPGSCCVLLTSRRDLFTGNRLQLSPLVDPASRDLLVWRLTERQITLQDSELDRLQELAGGLPLAIEWIVGRMASSAPHERPGHTQREPDGLLDYLFLDAAAWLRKEGYFRVLLSVIRLPSGAPPTVIEHAFRTIGQSDNVTSAALAALVNLNLVRYHSGQLRYHALPVVARFVLFHLQDAEVVPPGDIEVVESAVAEAFTRHLDVEAKRVWSGDYSFGDWALERQNAFDIVRRSMAAGRTHLALSCVTALYPFAITFGHLDEYIRWVVELLAGDASLNLVDRLGLRVRLASALFHTEQLDVAREEVSRVESDARNAGALPLDLRNFIYFVRSIVAVSGHDAGAEQLLMEAIAFERERGVAWARLGFQGWLVLHLAQDGRLDEARALAIASLSEAKALDDHRTEAFISFTLARVYNLNGEHALALEGARASAERLHKHGEAHNRAHWCLELGRAAMALGRVAEGREYVCEAAALYRTLSFLGSVEECERILSQASTEGDA
jgi:SIR2-like protein/NB-ARC domain-containing protein